MKKIGFFSILVPFLGAAVALQADTDANTLMVTASNNASSEPAPGFQQRRQTAADGFHAG